MSSADEVNGYLAETGSSGLKQYSGYIYDELLTNLRGRRAMLTYREMADNDATIGSMLFIIRQAMRKVTWGVEPPEDLPPELEAEAQQAVDFVKSCMNDMEHSWDDFITEVLTMLEFGFAPMEPVYKYRQGESDDKSANSKFADGYVGWRKISLRAQDTLLRWEFDEVGDCLGMYQQPWQGGVVFLPIEKLLLFRTTKVKNNPEGRSILRNSYRAWFLKKRLETIEGVGIERDLAGMPVMYIPSKVIEQAQKGDPVAQRVYNSYKTLIKNLRRDEQEGVILPGDFDEKSGNRLFDLQLLSTGSRRNFDLTATINRYMQEMAMSTMTDFVLLGHGARGTQALATTKVDVFMSSIQGLLDMVAGVLNSHELPRLWKLNGFRKEVMPRFVPDNAQQVDMERFIPMLQALASTGMPLFPDPNLEKWVRDQTGMPEPAPEVQQARDLERQMAMGTLPPEEPMFGHNGGPAMFDDVLMGGEQPITFDEAMFSETGSSTPSPEDVTGVSSPSPASTPLAGQGERGAGSSPIAGPALFNDVLRARMM